MIENLFKTEIKLQLSIRGYLSHKHHVTVLVLVFRKRITLFQSNALITSKDLFMLAMVTDIANARTIMWGNIVNRLVCIHCRNWKTFKATMPLRDRVSLYIPIDIPPPVLNYVCAAFLCRKVRRQSYYLTLYYL